MIEAKIVADSISSAGARITTFVLTYPRFIHSEFMTHRQFSRNASSSRAIPVAKQIQEVIDNPAIPLAFLKNKKGMQGGDPVDNQVAATAVWIQGRDFAVGVAKTMVAMDIHKQYVNRILEPYAHITVICTATQFDNFFALRVHPDAQPEICELATQMLNAYEKSQPKRAEDGYWHLPLLTNEDIGECSEADGVHCLEDSEEAVKKAIKRSVARCARVSYKNHDGTNTTLAQDMELYERLLGNTPIHASPAEHQAMAVPQGDLQSGNFRGWVQYRKTISDECIHEFRREE